MSLLYGMADESAGLDMLMRFKSFRWPSTLALISLRSSDRGLPKFDCMRIVNSVIIRVISVMQFVEIIRWTANI